MKEPIILIGMGRSGTTILAKAISTHKDLGWISKYLLFKNFTWEDKKTKGKGLKFLFYFLKSMVHLFMITLLLLIY